MLKFYKKSNSHILVAFFLCVCSFALNEPLFAKNSNRKAVTQKSTRIPKRSEIAEKYKWNLKDIYPSIEAFEKDYKKAEALLPKFSAFKGKLGATADKLYSCLKLKDEYMMIFIRLDNYSFLKLDEDTRIAENQVLTDRVAQLDSEFSEVAAFILPEILTIKETQLKNFYSTHPDLKLYRRYIENIKRTKKHILSAKQEAFFAAAMESASAPEAIYSSLVDADMVFGYIKNEAGEKEALTDSSFYKFNSSYNRRVRKEAAELLTAGFAKVKNGIAAAYSASVNNDIFIATTRKFESSLSMALAEENIPEQVYTNLIDTVHENFAPLRRYMNLRKKVLNIPEMHYYDTNSPLVKINNPTVPWEKAMDMTVNTISILGEEYTKVTKEGFKNGWIDVFENEGKRSGAYSTSIFGVHPYVLMNYSNSIDDAYTIAHEMGHNLHAYFSYKKQPFVYSDATIFTSEIASTMNENLMTAYLLKTAPDKKTRLYYLDYFIRVIIGYLFDVVMFAEFEQKAHELAENGETLTLDALNETFMNLFKEYYGDSIVVDGFYEIFWMKISHFYSAFYYYKYATSFYASLLLSKEISNGNQAAKERFIEFLSAGDSDYSVELIKKAGIDMTSKKPVTETLKYLDSLIDELETSL